MFIPLSSSSPIRSVDLSPLNCIITPSGFSISHTLKMSSVVSGSKYTLSYIPTDAEEAVGLQLIITVSYPSFLSYSHALTLQ